MRVLIRRFGEVIRIGAGVTVRVLETTCNRVRIAVEAPPGIRVIREEIYRAILRENQKAALSGPSVLDAAAGLLRDCRPEPPTTGSKMVH
jgi:carbon storage regulator